MADINTQTLSDLVRLADFEWDQGVKSVKRAARESGLFRVDMFPAGTGDTREYNSIDLEEYATIKAEGDEANHTRYQEGYTKVLNLTRYGDDISVTWEARQRNKYPMVLRKITNLAKQHVNRMELDLSHRLTFMAATSYTNKEGQTIDVSVGDTLALASSAHTLQGSSSTFRNILANNPQLSKGALEAIEKQAVENTLNQFGEKMSVMYDILWVTDDPNTNHMARELVQSTAEISAPNSGVVNVYQGKYKVVSLPRVATTATGAVDSTKAKYWGIASSESTSAYLSVEQEPTLTTPAVGKSSEDFTTDDLTYKARSSYGIVIVDANWVHVSKGDGTA